jgi:hypothetical protein
MAEKFFKKDDTPFMVSFDTFKIYMFIGDCWVTISDPAVHSIIRFQSTEISRAEAMALAGGQQADRLTAAA